MIQSWAIITSVFLTLNLYFSFILWVYQSILCSQFMFIGYRYCFGVQWKLVFSANNLGKFVKYITFWLCKLMFISMMIIYNFCDTIVIIITSVFLTQIFLKICFIFDTTNTNNYVFFVFRYCFRIFVYKMKTGCSS